MDPVSLNGRRLLIVDRPLNHKEVRVIAVGTAWHDGKSLTVVADDGSEFHIPRTWADVVELPLTGRWLKRWPLAEWYIIAPANPADLVQ